ncbi:MAG: zinc-dependent alcohol dehydrogenase family protein [Pseudomonadota bacterium]
MSVITDTVRPEPGPGEVVIEVAAIGLNRAETMYRRDEYIEPLRVPGGLGYEASGTVAQVGAGVTSVEVGDRVSTLSAHSMQDYWSYGDYAVMPERSVRRLPRGVEFHEGASIWNSWLTSHLALVEVVGLRAGQTVLVPAAASSTGIAAIQIAKRAGCEVIATCRTTAKRERLVDLGADHVIVTDLEDVVAGTLDRTAGAGADVIFDPVGGDFTSSMFDAVAPNGTILVYGVITGTSFTAQAFPMMAKSIILRGFTIFDFAGSPQLGKTANVAALNRSVDDLTAGFEMGRFRTVVHDQTFTLDEIVDAHRLMESGAQFGKIIVTT